MRFLNPGVMNYSFKFIILFLLLFTFKPASATTYNIKTVGEEFTPDTVYANIGDSIKFIIAIGHDAVEITDSAYINNTMVLYPGGFNYSIGTFYFVVDSSRNYYYGCGYHMASSQMKGVIIANGSTAVPNNKIKSSFSLFPNPVTNTLHINSGSSQVIQFIIWDYSGKIELTGTVPYSGTINVSELVPGSYLIEIILPDKKKYANFIKQ